MNRLFPFFESRSLFVLTAVMFLNSPVTVAEDDSKTAKKIESGLVPGEYVIPFISMNVTGEDKGKEVCLICKNEERPVGILFTRELTPAVIDLLDRLDSAIAQRKKEKLSGFAVLLTSKPGAARKELEKIAKKHKLSDELPLAFMGKKGPRPYHISPQAAVTVMLYDNNEVKHNFAFAPGKLTEKDTDRILVELEKMIRLRK